MKQKIFLFLSLIIFILSFGQILFNLLLILPKKNFIDFFVYYGALEKFLQGENPYNFLYGQPPDKVPFNYPPSALLVLLPLKIFPIKTSQILLTILSFLAFWSTFWLILKMTKKKISLIHFLILIAFFNQTFPVKFTLVLGQINLIVLGLAYGALYLYCYKNPKSKILNPKQILNSNLQNSKQFGDWNLAIGNYLKFGASNLEFRILSILLFSLASSLKIFPLFTLPLFLILKDFKFVFSVTGIFFALNLLPSFNLFKQYYFQIIPNINRSVGIPNFYDQSLLAFLLRLGLKVWLAKIILFFFLFIFLIFTLHRFYRGLKTKQFSNLAINAFSFIFCLFSIGGLFSWQHHLVFAYPLAFVLYLSLTDLTGRTIGAKIKKNPHLFFFFFLWLIFVFHFKTETSSLLKNPFIASYQTIGVLFLIFFSLFKPSL